MDGKNLTLSNLKLRNFRNYEALELSGLGALSVLVGPNAIGKTSIIEGIQLLTALQSFRHPTFTQMIHQGKQFCRLDALVKNEHRSLDISLQINDGKKKYLLNSKNKKTAELKGLIPSVTFTPDDLALVKGSSSIKRAAIDNLGSQLSSNHYVIKKDYEKVIRYKNQLLKTDSSDALLDSINETLITCASQLNYYRSALFNKLSPVIASYYSSITASREEVQVCYIPSWESYDQDCVQTFLFSREQAKTSLQEALLKHFQEEKIRKRSLIGPHADHIEFFINGRNAATYGSQGQQRSLVLAFKLAEVYLIQEILQQKPILLLDDVMSELDEDRRGALISFIEGDIQTFITTTNLSYFDESLLRRAEIISLPKIKK